MIDEPLPSWRDGPAKAALLDLLDNVGEVAPGRRVAVFDNDGTLWCEKPSYHQLDFLLHELRAGVVRDPRVADRAEFRALLDGDDEAVRGLGLERVGLALIGLFEGATPEAFEQRVRTFFATATHARGRSYGSLTYRPMLELLDALRAVGVTPFIVTGGGAEFVRAVSAELYAIPPWHVVGTTIAYRVDDVDGTPVLRRTAEVLGHANEGDVKVSNVRLHLGTRPILAAGNSPGDARMLDDVGGPDRDGVGLLVDHDDDEREYAYTSVAGTFDAEPVLETAARRGWTVASIRRDWVRVFDEV